MSSAYRAGPAIAVGSAHIVARCPVTLPSGFREPVLPLVLNALPGVDDPPDGTPVNGTCAVSRHTIRQDPDRTGDHKTRLVGGACWTPIGGGAQFPGWTPCLPSYKPTGWPPSRSGSTPGAPDSGGIESTADNAKRSRTPLSPRRCDHPGTGLEAVGLATAQARGFGRRTM